MAADLVVGIDIGMTGMYRTGQLIPKSAPSLQQDGLTTTFNRDWNRPQIEVGWKTNSFEVGERHKNPHQVVLL
jgi:hypothetical protein